MNDAFHSGKINPGLCMILYKSSIPSIRNLVTKTTFSSYGFKENRLQIGFSIKVGFTDLQAINKALDGFI